MTPDKKCLVQNKKDWEISALDYKGREYGKNVFDTKFS